MAQSNPIPRVSDLAPSGPPREAYLTVREAAAIAGIADTTLYRWIARRRVRSFGWQGAIRVRLVDVMPEFEPIAAASPLPAGTPRGEKRTSSERQAARVRVANPRKRKGVAPVAGEKPDAPKLPSK